MEAHTEQEIILMLNSGKSYVEIQEALNVSSKTIAATKKAHFPSSESNKDALSRDSFQQYPKPPPPVSTIPIEIKPINNPIKKNTKMSTRDEYCDNEDEQSTSKYDVEKFKIKLAHELEVQKLQLAREEKEREYDLREQEMELKRDELEAAKRKVEEQKRGLLFRIKKLFESCENGEYSYEDADSLLEEARKVLNDSEEYCFITGTTFQGTVSHSLLNKVISALNDFLEPMDEDDTEELEFDAAFRRQLNRATFQEF